MSIIIKNKTLSPIEINDLGITIPVGNYDLSTEDKKNVASSIDLVDNVNSDNLIILDPLDGITELSKTVTLGILSRYNDPNYRTFGASLSQLSDVDLTGATIGHVLALGSGGIYSPVTPDSIVSNISADTFSNMIGSTFVDSTTTQPVLDTNANTVSIDVKDLYLKNTGDVLDSGVLVISASGSLSVIGSLDVDSGATATLNKTSNQIINWNDITNKAYVDSVVQGLNAKASVRVATVTSGTLATSFSNGQTVDGVVLFTGNRILIKNQTTQSENGIYIVSASGTPTRATDANTWNELVSSYVFVEEGSTNADTGWVSTVNTGGTLGTTNITFVQFSSAGIINAGSGLTKTGNTLSVNVDASTIDIFGNNIIVKDLGITAAKIANVTITDAQISSSAAITRSKIASGLVDRVVVNDGSGVLSESTVTTTELGYVSGVTSSIQTQLNSKLNLSGGTMSGVLNMGSNAISNLADPINPQDAATKNYVDTAIQGLDSKSSVRVATTVNGSLSTAFSNSQVVDGITLATGDRILIKNQTTQSENGIYIVSASGAPTRATDANTWNELVSSYVFVEEGSTNADTGWVSTVNTGGTLGTTNITFVQFSSAGIINAGSGLTKTGNTLSVNVDASTIDIFGNNIIVKDLGITAAKIANSTITNTQISSSAAISRSKIASGLVNRVVVNDGSGVLSESTVTTTELGYVSGVTSSIQTQLNSKLNLSGGTMSGVLNMGSNVISNVTNPISPQDAATKNYVDSVVGAVSTPPNATESAATNDTVVLTNISNSNAKETFTVAQLSDGVASALGITGLTVRSLSGGTGQTQLFLYDSGRSAYLSVAEFTMAFSEADLTNSDWVQIGTAADATTGYVIPHDATIVRMSLHCAAASSQSKGIDMYIGTNSPIVSALTVPAGTGEKTVQATNLNYSVAGGEKIRLRAGSSGGTIGDTVITLWLRWRS